MAPKTVPDSGKDPSHDLEIKKFPRHKTILRRIILCSIHLLRDKPSPGPHIRVNPEKSCEMIIFSFLLSFPFLLSFSRPPRGHPRTPEILHTFRPARPMKSRILPTKNSSE